MSSSLRDQLLKAGLISKQQANDAERQLQRQERQPKPRPKPKPKPLDSSPAAVPRPTFVPRPPDAKVERDRELNRRQREKAERKARTAAVSQIIEQHRLPAVEAGDAYHFVDGAKIRRVPVTAEIRDRLTRGELAIVRHAGRYDFVPTAVAARVRERDPDTFVFVGGAAADGTGGKPDDDYAGFSVPDDLIW